MKKLLTILHAEDHLSPSALSIVKGGDAIIMSCGTNTCDVNLNICTIKNECGTNDQQCERNACVINCRAFQPQPPSCQREVITT